MTTVSEDVDLWAADIEVLAAGIPVTRDPGTVTPPCIYISSPDVAAQTVGEIMALDFPVYLIAPGEAGKVAGDWLLDNLPLFLKATDTRAASPEPAVVNSTEYPAYRTTARLHITPSTP